MSSSDPLVIDFQRLCQHHADQWLQPANPEQRLRFQVFRQQYCQLAIDAPNLLWLYTLMLDAGIDLPQKEIVAAMKQRFLQEEFITPLSWRLLANGSSTDVLIVLGARTPPEEGPTWRWDMLVAWLQILSGLHQANYREPIPEPVQQLFSHDLMASCPELDEVQFRGAWMHFGTLRSILYEAEQRLQSGLLDEFIQNELTEVTTWLAADEPDLDANQIRAGWTFLNDQAKAWKANTCGHEEAIQLKWRSPVTKLQRGAWMLECITDAWTLRRLALSQRHCADRFLDGCLDGKESIFTISDINGKIQATVRLSLVEATWVVADIRGFANSLVTSDVTDLLHEVTSIYNEHWQSESPSATDAPINSDHSPTMNEEK